MSNLEIGNINDNEIELYHGDGGDFVGYLNLEYLKQRAKLDDTLPIYKLFILDEKTKDYEIYVVSFECKNEKILQDTLEEFFDSYYREIEDYFVFDCLNNEVIKNV